jgi:hypothetical protein
MKLKSILLTSVLAVSGFAVVANAADMQFTSGISSDIKVTIDNGAGAPIKAGTTTDVPYSVAALGCAVGGGLKDCDFAFSINGTKFYELTGDLDSSAQTVTISAIKQPTNAYVVSTTDPSTTVTPPKAGDVITHVWIAPNK